MILGQPKGRNTETGNSRRKGKKRAPRNGVIMGCKRGAPWGKLRDLSHPPIAVQSLHSPVISIFIQSHSHSHRRCSSSGPENHARSRLHHPLSAPESRTLPVTRKYRPQRCPFRFRVPTALGFGFFFYPSLGRLAGRGGKTRKYAKSGFSRFSC